MKRIDIEDDIYDYLLKNVKEIGESASDILRRLLKLPSKIETPIQIDEDEILRTPEKDSESRFTVIIHWNKIDSIRNDETISKSLAVETFVLTLRRIVEELGEEVIAKIKKIVNRELPLIFEGKLNTRYQIKPLGFKNYYVSVHSDNKGKKRLLEKVNQALGSPNFLEIIMR